MTIMYTDTDHPSLDIERSVIEGAGMSFTVKQCKTEDDVIAMAEARGVNILLMPDSAYDICIKLSKIL